MQFRGHNVQFSIYPSSKFRKIHPLLKEALKSSELCTLDISLLQKAPHSILGYIDFLFFIVSARVCKKLNLRARLLAKALNNREFSYVHLLEFQHAGYLYLDAIQLVNRVKNYKLITTNWGSDIYFYQGYSSHKIRIKQLLQKADLYSAECERDYELARALDYVGQFLPCIPNAGGYKYDQQKLLLPKERDLIICKAYGEQFGRGDLLLEVLDEFLLTSPNTPVFLYSVTDDLLSNAYELASKYPNIRISDLRNKLSHQALLEIFRSAQIYLGLSRSDGISTSFLEALNFGAYPIQSNTSCAQEWIMKGAVAGIVSLDKHEILDELEKSYNNFKKLDVAQYKNLSVARKYLDYEIISQVSRNFYS